MAKRRSEEAVEAIIALRAKGVFLQDLLGVLLRLRPMARCLCPDGAGPQLSCWARSSGLALRRYTDPSGARIALIGRDPRRLAECERLDQLKQRLAVKDPLSAGRKIGTLLGYPCCCVAAFDEKDNARFPLSVLERSGPGPYPFFTNFLYSFQSRSYGPQEQLVKLWKSGYAANDQFLLPWIPCHFDCRPSADYGSLLLSAIEAFDPAYAQSLRRTLARPILYYDDWSFAALDGARRVGEGWRYSGLGEPRTLLAPRLAKALAASDSLRLTRAALVIAGLWDQFPRPTAVLEFRDA